MRRLLCLALVAAAALPAVSQSRDEAVPCSRSVMDAHNCYPYGEWWYNRIDRALSAGTPLAIEQDLDWYTDPKTGKSWEVVSHGGQLTGTEPTMEHYFFDRVRPSVEQALKEGNRGNWPLITLNLDFKRNNAPLLESVWALLSKYQDWLTIAPKTSDPSSLAPLTVRPILVLTGESDAQQAVFYDQVGGKLLVFGAVHNHDLDPMAPPDVIEPEHASNYRRWWNNPWNVVEDGSQQHAGLWTAADDARLRSLVRHAHATHLWIRFYTLDGATEAQESCNGWFHSYNFGSLHAAELRWRAAQLAGVDYIASDQYELLGSLIHHWAARPLRQ
jgi:hypothetical protein